MQAPCGSKLCIILYTAYVLYSVLLYVCIFLWTNPALCMGYSFSIGTDIVGEIIWGGGEELFYAKNKKWLFQAVGDPPIKIFIK